MTRLPTSLIDGASDGIRSTAGILRCAVGLALLLAAAPGEARAAAPFIPLLEPGDAIPPIPLRTQDGRPFTLADLHGNAIAVSFIYTRCRDPRMCALVSAKFANAQHAIGHAPIRLVLITLDPRYDSARVLAQYGRAFGQDRRYWTLARGSPALTDELAGRLGIATAVTAPGTLAHAEAAIIIAPDGRIAQMIAGDAWSPSDLIDYARAALPARPDPWLAVRAWLGATLERCGGGALTLGNPALLGILGLAIASVGGAFWLAFRGALRNDA